MSAATRRASSATAAVISSVRVRLLRSLHQRLAVALLRVGRRRLSRRRACAGDRARRLWHVLHPTIARIKLQQANLVGCGSSEVMQCEAF